MGIGTNGFEYTGTGTGTKVFAGLDSDTGANVFAHTRTGTLSIGDTFSRQS